MSSAQYELVCVAGVGGMATVHLGRTSRGPVAIKRLHDFLAEDPAHVAAFVDEGRLLSCISHPNVVRVIELADIAGSKAPVLVLEWIDGVTVEAIRAAVARRGSGLAIDVVAAIACDLLAGLHAAHEATSAEGTPLEIVHRDVSPENVLVGVDGVARLTDFGIAKDACRRTHVTEADAVKGKLRYLAPEQLASCADRRTDIYAAAIVVWELVTGRRLRTHEGMAVLVEILEGRVPPKTGTPLDGVLARALSRDPDERFATAAAMAAEIEARVGRASSGRVADTLAELFQGEEDGVFANAHGVALASEDGPELPACVHRSSCIVRRSPRVQGGREAGGIR